MAHQLHIFVYCPCPSGSCASILVYLLFTLLNSRGQPWSKNDFYTVYSVVTSLPHTVVCSGGAGMSTCASERAALGSSGGRRFVPLRHALQQVVQTPKTARQIAQEALLPGAVLGWQARTAHMGGWVRCCVTAGVAQRLVRMGALGMTKKKGIQMPWLIMDIPNKTKRTVFFNLQNSWITSTEPELVWTNVLQFNFSEKGNKTADLSLNLTDWPFGLCDQCQKTVKNVHQSFQEPKAAT